MSPDTLARLLGLHGAENVAALLGAPTPPQAEPRRAEVLGAVIRGAVRFRLAGGVWLPADFAALAPWVQEAVVEAGERVAAATAINTATAARGPVGAAQVMVPLDGGASLRAAAVEEAMREARSEAIAAFRGGP